MDATRTSKPGDLFGHRATEARSIKPAEASTRNQANDGRDLFRPQLATVKCKCGKQHTVSVYHYDAIIVDCGAQYFAVQPKRYGPMKLVPHPGQNLTAEEMKQKHPELYN